MDTHAKVLNVTSNMHIKRSQALRRIDQCISTWVDSFTIRDLSLAERVNARSEKARLEEGLGYFVEGKDGKLIRQPYFAELPRTVFRLPNAEHVLGAKASRICSNHHCSNPIGPDERLCPNCNAPIRERYALAAEANRFAVESLP